VGKNGQLNSSHRKSRFNNHGSNFKTKRKCLDLSKKVAVINYAKGHPNLGARQIAEHVFLPENTTSKTQPLDAGIITNWKAKYKKRLLRYVCSQVDGSRSASNIVK
jgi:hypothetical protein